MLGFKRCHKLFLGYTAATFALISLGTVYFGSHFSTINNSRPRSISAENATKPIETESIVPFLFSTRAPNTQKWLATWFATFKTVESRRQIQLSTIVNRGKFVSSLMRPILFQSDKNDEMSNAAHEHGWHTFAVPRTNEFDTPFLLDMIKVTMAESYNSVFYGFANDDILFGDSLVVTLKSVTDLIETKQLKTPILVIGQKSNYITKVNWTEPVSEFFFIEQIKPLSQMDLATAIDYFFFTVDFPMFLFDGLVIGRPAYDNYVVAEAIRRKVTVIDATKTLSALHLGTQKSQSDPKWGGKYDSPDMNYNRLKLPRANYSKGSIHLAPYATTLNLDCLCADVKRIYPKGRPTDCCKKPKMKL